jgi:hypothetical protein
MLLPKEQQISDGRGARAGLWSSPLTLMLLPSDTQRKPITSITAVLLPFVTYLLTFPRIIKDAFLFICDMTDSGHC